MGQLVLVVRVSSARSSVAEARSVLEAVRWGIVVCRGLRRLQDPMRCDGGGPVTSRRQSSALARVRTRAELAILVTAPRMARWMWGSQASLWLYDPKYCTTKPAHRRKILHPPVEESREEHRLDRRPLVVAPTGEHRATEARHVDGRLRRDDSAVRPERQRHEHRGPVARVIRD
jgi:hypothetical protein